MLDEAGVYIEVYFYIKSTNELNTCMQMTLTSRVVRKEKKKINIQFKSTDHHNVEVVNLEPDIC